MTVGTWRALPDSNRLPSAVLADVLPEALHAHIAATTAADGAQPFGHLLVDYLALTCDHMTDDCGLLIVLLDYKLTGPQALPPERRFKFRAHGLAVFAM